jgi:hypothetical protein
VFQSNLAMTTGICCDCKGYSNGKLGVAKSLVDGLRCRPCYLVAVEYGEVPPLPRNKKPKEPKVKEPSGPSSGVLKRRSEEEKLVQVLESLDKGTHFLELASKQLNWPITLTETVYYRLKKRGYRREKHKGQNLYTVLKQAERPLTFDELMEATFMAESSVHAALSLHKDKIVVTRDGRKRLYALK